MQVRRLGQLPDGSLGLTSYQEAWDEQRRTHAQVVAGAPNTTLLVQHEAVFTAGKRTEAHERPFDGTPVIDVDRGGKITWHGPGQLTVYPIYRLTTPLDVVAYVRLLEEVMIRVCAHLGLATQRVAGASGVWVLGDGVDRKVGAIGLRVAQGVAMHGFALNCNPDLAWAQHIVPCGIAEAGVTSLSQELGRTITVEDAMPFVEDELRAHLPEG